MQFVPSENLTIDRKARANMPFYDLDLRLPICVPVILKMWL